MLRLTDTHFFFFSLERVVVFLKKGNDSDDGDDVCMIHAYGLLQFGRLKADSIFLFLLFFIFGLKHLSHPLSFLSFIRYTNTLVSYAQN